MGTLLSRVLADTGTLVTGLALAGLAFVAGRLSAHFDRPHGRGLLVRYILTGTAFGFLGWTLLRALFVSGPGWPWTPWWVLLGGFGVGLYRSHQALLRQARESDATTRRLWGFLHPKDAEALVVLLVGYALVGLMGFLVLRAFSGLIPGSGKLLTIAIAVYLLQGARLLLRFAGEERAGTPGIVGWLKANALQNAIVLLLLVAYATFRDTLASSLPFYPLVEFGLGIAIFAFVLARLRARMRRDGAPLATSSEARDHARTLTELREGEYDEIARPVTRFIEAGLGQGEYGQALLATLAPGDPRRQKLLEQLSAHREPPRPPPLALPWIFAAGATLTAGLAAAAIAVTIVLFDAPMPYPLLLALLFIGFGVYAQQDAARSHFRPRLAVAIAGAGTALLLLTFLLFSATVASLAAVPGVLWGIVGAIAAGLVGVPAFASWRLEKRIQGGQTVDARRVAPALELQNEIQKVRKRAATMTLVAFTILLPVPWLAGWLAERGLIPQGFPDFLGDLLGVAIWVIAGIGASAIVRFYGLTRNRPALLQREREKRDRRLAVHRTLMQSLERM